MRQMYIQPKNEMVELTPFRALLQGSVIIKEDPGTGTGGDAPRRQLF